MRTSVGEVSTYSPIINLLLLVSIVVVLLWPARKKMAVSMVGQDRMERILVKMELAMDGMVTGQREKLQLLDEIRDLLLVIKGWSMVLDRQKDASLRATERLEQTGETAKAVADQVTEAAKVAADQVVETAKVVAGEVAVTARVIAGQVGRVADKAVVAAEKLVPAADRIEVAADKIAKH